MIESSVLLSVTKLLSASLAVSLSVMLSPLFA